MTQFKLACASAMCVLVGCGSSGVQGDGQSLSETRALGPFSSIEADTDVDVVVSESTSQSVVVTADENLVPMITTRVGGSTLFIGQQEGIRPRAASVVTVSIPTLQVAELDGAGSMTIGGFSEVDVQLVANGSGDLTASLRANALEVSVPGSGGVNLSGQAATLTLSSTGSGSVEATELGAGGANVKLDGSGDASLVVGGASTLDVTGSGSISAELDDGDTRLSVSGSGSIIWSGDAIVTSESQTGSGTIVHH